MRRCPPSSEKPRIARAMLRFTPERSASMSFSRPALSIHTCANCPRSSRPRREKRASASATEADARFSRRGLELRGQFAQVWIDNAGRLNDMLALRSGVNRNIARAIRGFSLEGGQRLISNAPFGEVGAFVRYENFDTQFR